VSVSLSKGGPRTTEGGSPPQTPSFPPHSASEDGYLPRPPLLPRLVRRIDPDSHTASTAFVSSGPDHWRLLLFVVDLQALHTTPTITTWTTRSQSLVLSLPCSPSSSRGRGAGISEVAARFVFVKQRFLCVVLLLVGLCCSGPGSGRADAEGCAEAPFRFVCVRFVSFACLVGVLLVCVVVFCASARALTGCQCLALLAISSTCLTLFSEFFSSFPHGTLYAIGLPLHI